MKEHRRVSQIVNNFFTLASIVIISIVITLYAKFGPKKESPPRINSNIECQKITKTIDSFSSKEDLNFVYNNYIKKGFYKLDGGFIKPRFGKFYLKDIISLKQSDGFFTNALKYDSNEDMVRYLTIKYEIIENDKNDPRKKSDYDKSYAGTLLVSFRFDSKEIFMMKSDFLNYDKNSIENRINCTIEAFKHNAK